MAENFLPLVAFFEDNHTVQKAWRALHFVMRVVKKGNKNTKVLRTSHWYVRFSNMGQRVGTHTGNAR